MEGMIAWRIMEVTSDARETVASKLYERGYFSLGRAAEWAGLSIEAMKEALHQRGISRQAPESPSEVEAIAREALKVARRPTP
jgi:predicted HTH domain antitoxin